MMIAALLALALGAVAGIFLATRHFLHKRLPASVALFHGVGGASGFALVLLTVVREPGYEPIREVLYLLIATVLFGVINLLFHIRKVRHRTSLILLHGFTAVTAAGMLIRAIWLHIAPAAALPTTAPQPAAPTDAPSIAERAPARDAGKAAEASETGTVAGNASPPGKPESSSFVLDEKVRRSLELPIAFASNTTSVGQSTHAAIVEVARVLRRHPEITLVEVQGHADERGDDGRNVELTQMRAQAVVVALVASGIARTRLHSAGYAARCPDDPKCASPGAPDSCHSPASWQRDRRVVLTVLEVNSVPFHGRVVCDRGVDLIPAEDRRFHSGT